MRKLSVCVCLLVMALAVTANADVKPNPIFSDNAVLQRNIAVPVWGTADNGEKVTVSFQNQIVSTTAKDGKWLVKLKPLQAGGPFTMTIAGRNKVEIKNLLVGEVWVASGQSNMQMTVAGCERNKEEIASSEDPMLRLLTVNRNASLVPVAETDAKWLECGPATVGDFSGVAYFFGRELRKKLECPVGLINASWGGTRVEAWMSAEALKPFEGTFDPGQSKPDKGVNPNQASVLYNGLIYPILPYPIKGAIWYQGESNAGRAYQYHDLFSAMIASWRKVWGVGDFPFLFVQLAPFGAIVTEPVDSRWAELREAQLMTTKTMQNAAQAVITDCGNPDNIHPKLKQPVGERLAFAARALAYGEDVPYKGPCYQSMTVVGNRAILQFDDVFRALVAKDGDLTGFTVAGEDRVFHNARATIQGTRVVVSSDEVAKPVAVRFGWWDCPVVNLFDAAGLPASPFRTDTYPMITAPKPDAK
jgi:sialate O-acetylesterase